MTRRPRLKRGRGFSLVEVMVGMSMLTAALLGLAAAASTGMRQTSRAREDSQEWADAQRVADSLIMRGYNTNTSSSTSVNGRPIKWKVESPNTTVGSQMIRVIIWRHGYQSKTGAAERYSAVTDTIVLYLSNGVP
jgi:Tfp pilus assembly protein PilV